MNDTVNFYEESPVPASIQQPDHSSPLLTPVHPPPPHPSPPHFSHLLPLTEPAYLSGEADSGFAGSDLRRHREFIRPGTSASSYLSTMSGGEKEEKVEKEDRGRVGGRRRVGSWVGEESGSRTEDVGGHVPPLTL